MLQKPSMPTSLDEGGDARDAIRRQGTADRIYSRSRPGDFLRAQADLPFREPVPNEAYTLPIGKARVVTEGTGLTVVAWGAMVVEAAKAAEKSDASIELIDLRTISPLDEDTILGSVEKTGRCVVCQEAPLTLGLASEISSLVTERCFLHLEAPVQRVAGFDTIMPYYKLEMEYLRSRS